MIHRIYSSLPTFKQLEFNPGLNVLLARKEAGASNRQTRNRAGKTSLIEIVHFLMGANVEPRSPFRLDALIDHSFSMELDVGGAKKSVERCGRTKSRVRVSDTNLLGSSQTTNTDWADTLGQHMFGLSELPGTPGRHPTFRSLFGYFARRESAGGFSAPEKHVMKQQPGDFQVNLLYLLGLDWQVASDWQGMRDRKKALKALKEAAKTGVFEQVIGRTGDLRTQLTVAEARLQEVRSRLQSFRVLARYRELEQEADGITKELNTLANDNVVDTALIRDLETALQSEAPPPLSDLESVYAEAGIALPGIAVRRYDEVRSFHESVIRNRRDYLSAELMSARQRRESRTRQQEPLDRRRSQILRILRSHGALDQFSKLQEEGNRLEVEVENLRHRFEAAERLECSQRELEIERHHLELRLHRDFSERQQRLKEAIWAFERTSERLYELAGRMTVDVADGPEFRFDIQGSRSKGIKNMQIFCFDLMLMRLCASHGRGPGFLVHDSHLFDGVDGRQIISALKVGAETAEELGFQYIVTMNGDDAFKEAIDGFDLRQYVLPVTLTDATGDGGLFGFRFG